MPSRTKSIDPLALKPKRTVPYPFVVEALSPLEPEIRRVFSGFGVYVGDKIVLMLRDRPQHREDNGLWLVFSETADLNDPFVRRTFPSLRTIKLLGGKIGHWRLIPADGPTFESEALRVCDLLLKHDIRLGRIPVSRQRKSS